jgi:hypothetical protein
MMGGFCIAFARDTIWWMREWGMYRWPVWQVGDQPALWAVAARYWHGQQLRLAR